MSSDRKPQILEQDGVTIVYLGPDYTELDNFDAQLDELRDILLSVATTAARPSILLDMPHTRFFGSVFLGVLFRMWARLKPREGSRFGLCGLDDDCLRIIDVTHLDKLWGIFPNREAGIREFASD